VESTTGAPRCLYWRRRRRALWRSFLKEVKSLRPRRRSTKASSPRLSSRYVSRCINLPSSSGNAVSDGLGLFNGVATDKGSRLSNFSSAGDKAARGFNTWVMGVGGGVGKGVIGVGGNWELGVRTGRGAVHLS
jgi:hypothetical protein